VSCTQRFQPMSTNPEQHPVNIPWHYSLAISVIRTGQTEEQLVAASIIPGDSIDDFISMTPYDTHSETGGTHAPENGYYYVTPGTTAIPATSFASLIVSNGNRVWLEGNSFFLGEPNILGLSPTFDVQLNQGDTVIVRARKQALSDGPMYF